MEREVTPGGELRIEVLTHVYLAGQGVAIEGADEGEDDGIAGHVAGAMQLDLIAFDEAKVVAGGEVAFVGALQQVALLLQGEHVGAAAVEELDVDVPTSGKVACRWLLRALAREAGDLVSRQLQDCRLHGSYPLHLRTRTCARRTLNLRRDLVQSISKLESAANYQNFTTELKT